MLVSLAYNAASILYAIAIAIITSFSAHPNYIGLAQAIPGVEPIIPGITIPLVAGILALFVVLSVHEFSHGILARISKVKVVHSGALLFGIIPIGAFVEPDEKSILKLKRREQNRISSAGVSSNMLFAIIFFIPMVLFFYFVVPIFQVPYVYIQATVLHSAANVLTPGATILKWNGYNVSSISDFQKAAVGDTPNATVSVVTSSGSYLLKANSTGKVGVLVQQASRQIGGWIGQFAIFLYSFFALAFLLNFLIAVVNYLPIPSLDGWRIFNASIQNKKIVYGITAFIVIALLINALPLLWQL